MEEFTWVLLIYNGSIESISNLLYFHILFINDIVSKLIESPFHIIISIIAVPHGVVSGLKDIIIFFNFLQSSLSSVSDILEVGNSVIIGILDFSDNSVHESSLVAFIEVKIGWDAVVTVDVV